MIPSSIQTFNTKDIKIKSPLTNAFYNLKANEKKRSKMGVIFNQK